MVRKLNGTVLPDIRLACEDAFIFECIQRFPREDDQWLRENSGTAQGLRDIFRQYNQGFLEMYENPVELDSFLTKFVNALAKHKGSDILLDAVIEMQDSLRNSCPTIDGEHQQRFMDYLEKVSL